MKIERLFIYCLLAGTFLLASCSSEDVTDNPVETLPEGMYPLTFTATQGEVVASPQTRVSDYDDTDGKHKSEWDGGEQIKVQIGSGTAGTYTLKADGTINEQAQNTPAYWQSTATGQIITAWYPTTVATNYLKNQFSALPYVLKATATANFNTTPQLSFTHQLAKFRFKLTGTAITTNVTPTVTVKGIAKTTYINGDIQAASGAAAEDITPHTARDYYEVLLLPGQVADNFIKIDVPDIGTYYYTPKIADNQTNITLTAASCYTYEITVDKGSLKPVDGKFTINTGDDVTIKDYKGTAPIVVNGNATITLDNVQLTTSETAMTINNGADVTLKVVGTNNSLVSSSGSGIGAHENSNIEITGTSTTESKLEVTAGEGMNVGIGFMTSSSGGTYGNIDIENITLTVKAQKSDSFAGAAIGIASCVDLSDYHTTQCGNITIKNSNVTVSSEGGAACIGTSNWRDVSDPCYMGIISIEGSTVTATCGASVYGGYGACIGFGYINTNCDVTIQQIKITSSTLNLTTGAQYKVGKGINYGTATITDGIFVNNEDKGKDGWNP